LVSLSIGKPADPEPQKPPWVEYRTNLVVVASFSSFAAPESNVENHAISRSLFQSKDEPEGWGVIVLGKAPFVF
jgi:hypothetical protein